MLNEARKIKIAHNNLNITSTGQLLPQKNKKNPFLWLNPFTNKPPDVIRWIWSPETGEMRLGMETFHGEQIGKNSKLFDSWVRGFYFPKTNKFAVRPFYWPEGAYDYWDKDHRMLNAVIMDATSKILKNIMPNAEIELEVDNAWLKNKVDQFVKW